MAKLRKAEFAFILILLVYALYAGLFIYRTSFAVEGRRYFALFDDAMISMRYARNLAQGQGAVWNAGGERVEGYTNPLWMLYMALLHLLPAGPATMSLLVQLSALALLLVHLVIVRRVALLVSGGSVFVALAAVLLTAFYLPLNTWSLLGMEVSLLLVIVAAATLQALRALEAGRFSVWPYLLLGVGTLVRIDAAVPLVALLVFLAVADPKHRRQHLAWGLGLLAGFLLPQTLLRAWYYADPLPNTYYLKMTGGPLLLRLSRGLYVFLDFAWNLGWLLFLVPLGAVLWRRRGALLLLPWLFLAQAAYSVYVGGDAWEWWGGANRYICLGMPAFLIFAACVLERLAALLARELQPAANPSQPQTTAGHAPRTTHHAPRITHHVSRFTFYASRFTPHATRAALVALAFVTLTNFDSLYGRQSLAEWLLIERPLHVTDSRRMVQLALLVDRLAAPEARVAVVYAGVLPYFLDRPCIDLLGKSDRVVARGRLRVPAGLVKYISYYPGHQKWDYAHSIGELQPDVVTGLWYAPEEAEPYLAGRYSKVTLQGFTLYLRDGSPSIRWSVLERP